MNKRILIWLGITFFILFFLYEVRAILLPFVIGMLLAYLLDPLADALERRGVSRTTATAQITIGFLIVLVGAMVIVAPIIYHQMQQLITNLPAIIEWARNNVYPSIQTFTNYLDKANLTDSNALQGASANVSGWVSGVVTGIFASSLAILNFFSLLLIAPVVTFYLLRDWDNLVAKAHELLPREHADTIKEQLKLVDATLSGFLRGQLNVCMILGLFYAVTLQLAGLNYGIIAGLLFGLLVIIPYAGTVLSAFIALVLAIVQFDDWTRIAIVAAIFAFGQFMEGNFLAPRLVGKKVGIHPVWLIFGLMAGGALFGFIGVLIAVPVTAVIGVFIRFAIQRYLQSTLYAEEAESPIYLPEQDTPA